MRRMCGWNNGDATWLCEQRVHVLARQWKIVNGSSIEHITSSHSAIRITYGHNNLAKTVQLGSRFMRQKWLPLAFGRRGGGRPVCMAVSVSISSQQQIVFLCVAIRHRKATKFERRSLGSPWPGLDAMEICTAFVRTPNASHRRRNDLCVQGTQERTRSTYSSRK